MMEVKLSQLIDKKIIYQEKSCGFLKGILTKKDNAKILAIVSSKNHHYLAENIKTLIDKNIIINEKKDSKTEGVNWKNLKVISISGKRYGKIDEIWINANELKITKFSTCFSFFNLFKLSKRIFPVERILEIKENSILINDENNPKIGANLAKNVSFS